MTLTTKDISWQSENELDRNSVVNHFISNEDASGPDDCCLIYFYFDICRLSLGVTLCLVAKFKMNWQWHNQKQRKGNVFLFLKAPLHWVDMTTTVKVRKPAHLLSHLRSPAFICGSTKHFINTAVSGGASPLAPWAVSGPDSSPLACLVEMWKSSLESWAWTSS